MCLEAARERVKAALSAATVWGVPTLPFPNTALTVWACLQADLQNTSGLGDVSSDHRLSLVHGGSPVQLFVFHFSVGWL